VREEKGKRKKGKQTRSFFDRRTWIVPHSIILKSIRVYTHQIILSMLRSISRSLMPLSVLAVSLNSNLTCNDKNTDTTYKMPMRMLGHTGLQVSVLSYGFWATFGDKSDLKDNDGLEAAKACLRTARKYGCNLFDNAEVYGRPTGEAERIMGLAIESLRVEDPLLWRRSDILITTKIFWGGDGVNERGLSRKHIIEGVDASLERLKVSYVDLIFCHRPGNSYVNECMGIHLHDYSYLLRSIDSYRDCSSSHDGSGALRQSNCMGYL
jgi:hypothetical protein